MLALQSGIFYTLDILLPIGNQDRRCPCVSLRPDASGIMKVKASIEKEKTVGYGEDKLLEKGSLCPGEDQSDALAVFSHLFHPVVDLAPIGRIEPYPSEPGLDQSIVLDSKMLLGRIPWTDQRTARIEIEGSQRTDNCGWCQPYIRLHRSGLVASYSCFHGVIRNIY